MGRACCRHHQGQDTSGAYRSDFVGQEIAHYQVDGGIQAERHDTLEQDHDGERSGCWSLHRREGVGGTRTEAALNP